MIQIECCKMRSRDETNCVELQWNKPIGAGARAEIEYQAKLINSIAIDGDSLRLRFCDLTSRKIEDIMAETTTQKVTTSTAPITTRTITTFGTPEAQPILSGNSIVKAASTVTIDPGAVPILHNPPKRVIKVFRTRGPQSISKNIIPSAAAPGSIPPQQQQEYEEEQLERETEGEDMANMDEMVEGQSAGDNGTQQNQQAALIPMAPAMEQAIQPIQSQSQQWNTERLKMPERLNVKEISQSVVKKEQMEDIGQNVDQPSEQIGKQQQIQSGQQKQQIGTEISHQEHQPLVQPKQPPIEVVQSQQFLNLPLSQQPPKQSQQNEQQRIPVDGLEKNEKEDQSAKPLAQLNPKIQTIQLGNQKLNEQKLTNRNSPTVQTIQISHDKLVDQGQTEETIQAIMPTTAASINATKTSKKSNLLIRRKGMHQHTVTLVPPKVGEPIPPGIDADRERLQKELQIQAQLDAIREIEKQIRVKSIDFGGVQKSEGMGGVEGRTEQKNGVTENRDKQDGPLKAILNAEEDQIKPVKANDAQVITESPKGSEPVKQRDIAIQNGGEKQQIGTKSAKEMDKEHISVRAAKTEATTEDGAAMHRILFGEEPIHPEKAKKDDNKREQEKSKELENLNTDQKEKEAKDDVAQTEANGGDKQQLEMEASAAAKRQQNTESGKKTEANGWTIKRLKWNGVRTINMIGAAKDEAGEKNDGSEGSQKGRHGDDEGKEQEIKQIRKDQSESGSAKTINDRHNGKEPSQKNEEEHKSNHAVKEEQILPQEERSKNKEDNRQKEAKPMDESKENDGQEQLRLENKADNINAFAGTSQSDINDHLGYLRSRGKAAGEGPSLRRGLEQRETNGNGNGGKEGREMEEHQYNGRRQLNIHTIQLPNTTEELPFASLKEENRPADGEQKLKRTDNQNDFGTGTNSSDQQKNGNNEAAMPENRVKARPLQLRIFSIDLDRLRERARIEQQKPVEGSEEVKPAAVEESAETNFPIGKDNEEDKQAHRKAAENMREASAELLHSIAGMMEHRQKARRIIEQVKDSVGLTNTERQPPALTSNSREFAETMMHEIEQMEANGAKEERKISPNAKDNDLVRKSMEVLSELAGGIPQMKRILETKEISRLPVELGTLSTVLVPESSVSPSTPTTLEASSVAPASTLSSTSSSKLSFLFTSPPPLSANLTAAVFSENVDEDKLEDISVETSRPKEREVQKKPKENRKMGMKDGENDVLKMAKRRNQSKESGEEREGEGDGRRNTKPIGGVEEKKGTGESGRDKEEQEGEPQSMGRVKSKEMQKNSKEKEKEYAEIGDDNLLRATLKGARTFAVANKRGKGSKRKEEEEGNHGEEEDKDDKAKGEKRRAEEGVQPASTDLPPLDAFPSPPPSNRIFQPAHLAQLPLRSARREGGQTKVRTRTTTTTGMPDYEVGEEREGGTTTAATTIDETEPTSSTAEAEGTTSSRWPPSTRTPLYKRRQLDRAKAPQPVEDELHNLRAPAAFKPPRRKFHNQQRRPRPPPSSLSPTISLTGLPDEETDASPFDAERAQLLQRLRHVYRVDTAGRSETDTDGGFEGENEEQQQRQAKEEIGKRVEEMEEHQQERGNERGQQRGRYERRLESSRSPFESRERAKDRETEIRRKPSIAPAAQLRSDSEGIQEMQNVGTPSLAGDDDTKGREAAFISHKVLSAQRRDGIPLYAPKGNRPMQMPANSSTALWKRPSINVAEQSNELAQQQIANENILVPMNQQNAQLLETERNGTTNTRLITKEEISGVPSTNSSIKSSTMAIEKENTAIAANSTIIATTSGVEQRPPPLVRSHKIPAVMDNWAFWRTRTTVQPTRTVSQYDPARFYRMPNMRTQNRARQQENVLTFCSKQSAIRDSVNLPIACAGDDGTIWLPARCPTGTQCLPAADSAFHICCPVGTRR